LDNFERLTVPELLALSRRVGAELRERGVIRTGNLAGEYSEWLVRRATGGELARGSQRSWDVLAPDGQRLQVKARVVSGRSPGERELGVFRSWDFDALVVVLFGDDFSVWRATRLPVKSVEAAARWTERINGFKVYATDGLLDQGEDWSERLAAAAAAPS
jgi:hypothetical protein